MIHAIHRAEVLEFGWHSVTSGAVQGGLFSDGLICTGTGEIAFEGMLGCYSLSWKAVNRDFPVSISKRCNDYLARERDEGTPIDQSDSVNAEKFYPALRGTV